MSRDATLGGAGFNNMLFTINEVTDGMAYGTDSFNRPVTVPTFIQRAKGFPPLAGEQWIIEKSTGAWTLAAIVNNPPIGYQGITSGEPTATPTAGEGSMYSDKDGSLWVWNGTTWTHHTA